MGVRKTQRRLDERGRPAYVLLDLDDTLIEGHWPKMGDWLPDAQWAIREFIQGGYGIKVQSCRLNSTGLDESPRSDVDILIEQGRVRKLLTDAGFGDARIVFEDKPVAVLSIDDRNLRFEGNWRKTMRQVKRLGLL